MSSRSPKQQYKKFIQSGTLQPDHVQEMAVEALERLYREILDYKPKRSWFSKRQAPPHGVYMHGGVGRGKSMLMDMFYDCLPNDIPKRRVHFHVFMIEVHDYIHARRDDEGIREGVDAALPLLAQRIAERSRVLCFDEFHVVDVADAMILGRLFRCLFELGVVVVSTSNWEPDRLYEGGLQRERFLPFIVLLKEKQEIIHLDSPHDYRTQFLTEEGSYFSPLGKEAAKHADNVFAKLTDGASPCSEVLHVKGREILVDATAKGVARFHFDALCKQPLGAEDYLEVARHYHTVFLENIPILKKSNRNEAKRLMNLIDVLYENKINLIITADAPPEALYRGDHHAYEFERTVSRLQEMQSPDYIGKM